MKPYLFQKKSADTLTKSVTDLGGGLLLDDTGMGKTVTALQVAKNLGMKTSVVCPANKVGDWVGTAKRMGVNCEVFSYQKTPDRNAEGFVIVDEIHNLRAGFKSTIYLQVYRYTTHADGVLGLSATLFQNSWEELVHTLRIISWKQNSPMLIFGEQLMLFAKDKKWCRNLSKRKYASEYSSSEKHKEKEAYQRISRLERLLYWIFKDCFVKNSWEDIIPQLEKTLPKTYEKTVSSRGLYWRIDFKFGVQRYLHSLKEYETEPLMLGGLVSAYQKGLQSSVEVFRRMVLGHLEKTKKVLGGSSQIPPEFLGGMEEDIDKAEKYLSMCEEYQHLDKEKVNAVLDLIDLGGKSVVFTQYHGTKDLLKTEAKRRGIPFIVVDGSSRKPTLEKLAREFDANHPNPTNKIPLVIATDAASEGLNLHRANFLFEMDTPWNPSVSIQRRGRIYRLGSPHSEVIFGRFTNNWERLEGITQYKSSESERFFHLISKGEIVEGTVYPIRNLGVRVQCLGGSTLNMVKCGNVLVRIQRKGNYLDILPSQKLDGSEYSIGGSRRVLETIRCPELGHIFFPLTDFKIRKTLIDNHKKIFPDKGLDFTRITKFWGTNITKQEIWQVKRF